MLYIYYMYVGLTDCWHLIVDMFTPWIFPVHLAESSEAIM